MPRGLEGAYCRMERGNRREVVERNKHYPLDATPKAAERRRRMNDGLTITLAEAEEIIAFVKMHEREEIPEELWDIIMKLQEAME